MTTANFPPIGAIAFDRRDRNRFEQYVIKAIRGHVQTSTGALVAPSPSITIESLRYGNRIHMTIAQFFEHYYWEFVS